MKKFISPLLKIGVSAGLVWWLFQRFQVDSGKLAAHWKTLHQGWVGAAILSTCIIFLLGSIRWWLLLQVQKISWSFKDILAVGIIGAFFGTLSVGVAGVDAIRILYSIRHHPQKKSAVILSILADRLIGLLGSFILALLVLPLSWNLINITPQTSAVVWLIVGSMIGSLGFISIIVLSEIPGPWEILFRWRHRLPFAEQRAQFGEAVRLYLRDWKQCLLALALSIGVHTCAILAGYCLSRSFSFPLSFLFLAGMIPIVNVAIAIPVTISGFGIREGLLLLFFKSMGLSPDQAFAFSFALYGINLWVPVIGGLVYIFYRNNKNQSVTSKLFTL